jgi:DNA-binding MarR family transcriptional regulator
MRTIPPSPTPAETPAPARPDDREALSLSIIAQFRAALRELRCMGADRMRRIGLSFTHFHIVSLLDRHGEMPMSRLAEMLDISLSNASGVVDRLEELGYIERRRVPDDRRVVLVQITDAGRQKLTEAEVLKDEAVRSVLDRLDTDQLRRAATAVTDLSAAATLAYPELAQHDHLH